MRIADKNIKDAVETLISELENQEDLIADLNNEIRNLDGKLETKYFEIDKLTEEVSELSSYINELETALAEAHLMTTLKEKSDKQSP